MSRQQVYVCEEEAFWDGVYNKQLEAQRALEEKERREALAKPVVVFNRDSLMAKFQRRSSRKSKALSSKSLSSLSSSHSDKKRQAMLRNKVTHRQSSKNCFQSPHQDFDELDMSPLEEPESEDSLGSIDEETASKDKKNAGSWWFYRPKRRYTKK